MLVCMLKEMTQDFFFKKILALLLEQMTLEELFPPAKLGTKNI